MKENRFYDVDRDKYFNCKQFWKDKMFMVFIDAWKLLNFSIYLIARAHF